MSNRAFPVIYLCFFISGFAGLAYEVLWTRILGLTFGHTVYAVTTVLAAFMAGLALGSYLFGRLADRSGHPLRLYGLLELGIGLSCLLVPLMLSLVRQLYLSLYPMLLDKPQSRTLLQFALSFSVLIVPATLMGGTLPAVTRAVTSRFEDTARRVALLYGTNTLGAAAGAAAAGYWLLPRIGNGATNLIGALLSLFAGVLVLSVFRQRGEIARTSGAAEPAARWGAPEKILLWGFALSGAVSMSYQIAWVRALILVIGSSTYAFSAILITFLLGIALGSYLFKWLKLDGSPRIFAGLQFGIALSAFLLVPFFTLLPRLFLLLFQGYQGAYWYIILVQYLVVFPVVLLPTLLMGMTFPCAAGILTRSTGSIGRDVGRIYAVNTLGAVAGSLLAGFILIPSLGSQRTIALGIALNLTIALAVLLPAQRTRKAAVAAACVALAIPPFLLPRWNRLIMNSGVSIYPSKYSPKSDLIGSGPLRNWKIIFFREGLDTTVAVTESDGLWRSLYVNGKADASTSVDDMATQVKLAYLPMLLHQSPRRVAVIGLGSGVTAGAASLFEKVEAIDVLELEEAVREAAPLFSGANFNILSDPRLTVHIDDARSYIEGTRSRYDVIISEPSNPWMAGIASLYTAEFIERVKNRLGPGGIYCQWVQAYDLSPELLKLICRTFQSVFPDASLWQAGPSDYLLIGRTDGTESRSFEDILHLIQSNRQLTESLRAIKLIPVEEFLTSFILGPAELAAFAGDGPLNTDDRQVLEFLAPHHLYEKQEREEAIPVALAFKERILPEFVEAPGLENPDTYMRLGKYLLLMARLPLEATWHFERVPALSTFTAAPASGQAIPQGLLPGGSGRIVEAFTEMPQLPFIPMTGTFHPDEGSDDLPMWRAYQLLFARTSGTAEGAGRNGGGGMVLRSLQGLREAAFAFPAAVEPSSEYRVRAWLMSELQRGIIGIGIEEYDDFLTDLSQPTASFHEIHLLRREGKVLLQGRSPWTEHSFGFLTGPGARMVLLVFYRTGPPDPAPVFIDDILIERIGAERSQPARNE